MKIGLEQYRQLHLSNDELCVAAAFLELPCLYGVSDRWMKNGKKDLYHKVTDLAAAMEGRGLIMPELGGTVRMEPRLYEALRCMGRAEQVGRIRYSFGMRQGGLYLYRKADTLIVLEEDGKGGSYLGKLASPEELRKSLTGMEHQKQKQESEPGLLPPDWLGALLFERRGCFFEPVLDLAWSEDRQKAAAGESDLGDGWERLCRLLEKGREEESRGKV